MSEDASAAGDDTAGDDTAGDAGSDRTTIRAGREFEQEYRLDAAAAGDFLVDLGEQLREGGRLTVADEEWELPFAFGEPVTVEIDFEGVGEPELEIEVELPGRARDDAPDVA